MTKKLKSYIDVLPYIGIVTFIGGLVFALILLHVNTPNYWEIYNFFSNVVGVVLGYMYIAWWNPGGRVTLNFDKSKYSEDEKALYGLIVKYKSHMLMLFPPILFIVSDFVITKMNMTSYRGTLEQYLASVILGSFVSLSMCFGIKYFSTWWNIKKNWKKEFGE